MGLDVHSDEAGNLLARIRGRGERSILLCAHLDTVAAGGADRAGAGRRRLGERERRHPRRRQQGGRGGDPRGRAALQRRGLARRVELLFTVAEEIGAARRQGFDVSQLRAEFGYVFDHATPIGEIVTASPTLYRVEAEFHGKSAHAGLRPESGARRSSPPRTPPTQCRTAASTSETTANIGYFHGGVESTNVVAERARILAEVRSLDADKAEDAARRDDRRAPRRRQPRRVRRRRHHRKQVVGYRRKPSSPAVVAAEAALRAHGYEPRRIATGGASDANVLEAAGIPCVNVANGTEHNHEPTERVSVAALESMLDVTFTLLDEAAVGMSSHFERIGTETIFDGKFITVRRDTFRHEDGEVVQRELVPHPGAVGDRRPRRATSCGSSASRARPIGVPDLLEIPAGKLDEEGEDPLETAKRELAEEIGKQAAALGARSARSTPRRASPTRSSTSSSPPASPTSPSAPRSRRTSASTSSSARSPSSTRSSPRPGLQDPDRALRLKARLAARRAEPAPLTSARSVAPKGVVARTREGCERWPSSTFAPTRPLPPSRSSTSCSTSSRTSSSSAGSRATRSRPTAPTCCSTARI